jgi:hypothetical protein
VTAKAFLASKMEFRYSVLSDPWKRGVPDSVVISIRERPGLENSTEYGSWLIFTFLIAELVTPGPFASTPFTTKVTPPVAISFWSSNAERVVK